MNKRMKFKNIFTEYNESIEKTLNLDPMGLNVIWTHFGQRIFEGKISSATWDVRSFNINLFNHYVIKSLMDDGNDEIKELFKRDKKVTIEKLIILLENMVIWSWYKDKNNWDRKNLIGTSKAISKWKDKEINIDIIDTIQNIELLKGQKSLGVNGRYKGSFVNIGFFDSNYNNYFDDNEIFEKLKKLMEDNKCLKLLHEKVMVFFDNGTVENIPKDEYTNAFSKLKNLAKDIKIKEFWLKNLGLDNNEEEAIYKSIYEKNSKYIYKEANVINKSDKFETIIELEPKLSYLDALFNYLLFFDGTEVKNIEKKDFFKTLKELDFENEIDIADGEAKYRLTELEKVEDIESLIDYHQKVMTDRGYVSWIKIKDEKLVIDFRSKKNKEELIEKLKVGLNKIPWLHHYYVSSIRSIREGFENETI